MPTLPLARLLISGLLLALGLGLAPAPAHGQRLLAHYPLDGPSSPDASGHGHAAAWHGALTPTTDRFGQPCSALHFDGRSGYLAVPDAPALRAVGRQLSVAAWCRLDPIPATALRWLTLLCKGEGSTETAANPQFRVQVMQAPALPQSTVSLNSDFTEFDPAFAAHAFPLDTWFFYALTYDGTTVRTYQNGTEVFAFPYQGTLEANDAPLYIGRDAPGDLEFLRGSLDELRLYDGALSAAQVAQLYRAPATPGPADLVLNCPARQVVDAAPGQCSAVVTFALPTASSRCGAVVVRQVRGPRSGEAFAVGNTTLTFEAESADGGKQNCYASVRVVDREPPRFLTPIQPDTVLQAPAADPTGAVWRYAPPTATDNCAGVQVRQTQGPAPGGRLPLGRNEVVFVATDRQGNQAEYRRAATVLPAAAVPKATPVPSTAPTLPATPSPLATAGPPVALLPVPLPASLLAPVLAPAAQPTAVLRPDSIKPGITLGFRSCAVTVVAYDGFDEDGDSVSLFFNRREVVAKQMLRLKAHAVIVRAFTLAPDEKNSLVVKAWNIGKPGTPNTLKVEFFDGLFTEDEAAKLLRKQPRYLRTMYALPGMSDSINLTCKKP